MSMIPHKATDYKIVLDRLRDLNVRIEKLLGQLPTHDDKILSELDILMNQLQKTLLIQTTKEKGSLFLEQATGKSMMLKERYHMLLGKGFLRKSK